MSLTLRPYQSGAIQGIYNYFHEATGNPLVVIPTAGGKSRSSRKPDWGRAC